MMSWGQRRDPFVSEETSQWVQQALLLSRGIEEHSRYPVRHRSIMARSWLYRTPEKRELYTLPE